jgi:hypothetical protein
MGEKVETYSIFKRRQLFRKIQSTTIGVAKFVGPFSRGNLTVAMG